MKIIFVVTGLPTGGAEMMLYRFLSAINRKRFDIAVVSLADRGTVGERIEALGIPVYTVGMTSGALPTPRFLLRLIRIINSFKPNIIQGWMYHGNLAAQLVGLLSKRSIPVVWSVHYSIDHLANEKALTRVVIKMGTYLSRFPARIHYVSKTSQMQHVALGYNSDKGYIIPNGFDVNLFTPSLCDKSSIRRELGLPEHTLLIGAIGRFHPMKDHANFLKAAAIVMENYPDVHFILVGHKIDLSNIVLERSVRDLGLLGNVHLLGERTDMPNVMAALDIATSPSASGEAFPMVIGEAMSCGVPCVVTNVGDSALIVGETGKVVPPKNASALAQAWEDLIRLGSARKELGQAARERIVEHFSLEKIVGLFESMYEEEYAKRINQL